MSSGKIIAIIVALLVLAVGVSTWFLVNNLDRFAKQAVEEIGSELLGTQVSLTSVDVTPLKGKAILSGLQVANPEAYSDAFALSFGEIEVDIDLGSFDESVMVIEKILILDPRISYEVNRQGVANIDVLLDNIDSATGGGDTSGRLIIDRLDVKGGSITASAAHQPGKTLVFDFPVVFMTDLGSPDGATPDEIGSEIAGVLMERIINAATRAGVQSLADEQKDRLLEKAGEKLDEKLKDLLQRD